jgi:hypothetical protein
VYAVDETACVVTVAVIGHRLPFLDRRAICEPGPLATGVSLTGYNDTHRAAYETTVTGPDGRTALHADLWLMLPQGPVDAIKPVVDLSVDFDAIRPGPAQTHATIPADLKVAVSEIVDFLPAPGRRP